MKEGSISHLYLHICQSSLLQNQYLLLQQKPLRHLHLDLLSNQCIFQAKINHIYVIIPSILQFDIPYLSFLSNDFNEAYSNMSMLNKTFFFSDAKVCPTFLLIMQHRKELHHCCFISYAGFIEQTEHSMVYMIFLVFYILTGMIKFGVCCCWYTIPLQFYFLTQQSQGQEYFQIHVLEPDFKNFPFY